MSFYSTTLTVSSSTYPTTPQVDLRDKFVPDFYDVRNKSTDADFVLSWDGVNDGPDLNPNEPDEARTFETHAQRLWIRRASGTGTAIKVDAWTRV